MSAAVDPSRDTSNVEDVPSISTQTESDIEFQQNHFQNIGFEENSTGVTCNEDATTSTIQVLSEGVANTYSENATSECIVPFWAAQMNDYQVIGNSYCGWVSSMDQLELLLTYHRQDTKSSWGIRQTTSSGRSSLRLMWKSQYAPFDGIPFINTGSRAIIMECKHGPRRKGNSVKRPANSTIGGFKLACPARIYIKQVKKFPEYSLHVFGDKKNTKEAMERAFFSLKMDGIDGKGEDRWYVQLPTPEAHEFHDNNKSRRGRQRTIVKQNSIPTENPCQASGSAKSFSEANPKKQIKLMHPRLMEKVREMIASGQKDIIPIRKALRIFVEKELFPNKQIPNRHNPYYFPTVYDVQNFVHQELKDLESSSLMRAQTDSQCSSAVNGTSENDVSSSEIQKEMVNTSGNSELKSITLTLSQNQNPELAPVISRIETHLSDGTTQVTSELNSETLQMLRKLQPLLFSQEDTIKHNVESSSAELDFEHHSLSKDTTPTHLEAMSVEDTSSKELNVDIFIEN